MARKPALCPVSLVCLLVGLVLVSGVISSSRAETLTYPLSLSRSDVRVVTELGYTNIKIASGGYDFVSEEGAPELPFRIVNILLPQGQLVDSFTFEPGVGVVLSSDATIKRAGAAIAEDGTVGKSSTPVATADGAVFPKSLGRYLGTGFLHGRAIASFAVFPFQLDGSELTLTEDVQLQVVTKDGGDEWNPVVRERFRSNFQDKVARTLSRFVINPEADLGYEFDEVRVEKKKGGFQPTTYPSLEGSPVDYLIITTDALAAEFQRLADWKTSKGVPTVVRTTEFIEANTRNGVDLQETMRIFIQDAYAKWGITYVLLGGDTDVLPPRYALSRFYLGGTELPVDMYFSCLDGSWNDTHDRYWGEGFNVVPYDNPDLYSEVYNGRIPRSTPADVSAMIDKIIAYETPCNMDYQNRYMFLAEVLFPVDWKNPDPISLNGADFGEFINSLILSGKPLDVVKMYETDWLYANAVPENKNAAIDSMEQGFNHVNHIGHGFRFNMSVADASIQNADADVLTNDCQFFNLYMLNCTAAAFNFYCLGEHFLANPTGGAVSVIGANESAFPNASGNYMSEYYGLIYDDDVVHIGEAFARSRLPRTPVAESGDNVDLWTHYIYAILADPEMPLFTQQVETANVFYPSSVGLGTSSILVNVTSGGQPVDSAHVCLSKGDDDYQHAATNSLGNVVFDFTAESPGDITVVVTGLNLARYEGTITVTPSASAYVNYAGIATIDDDMAGGTFGNGDGVIDAGETVNLWLEMTNTGNASSAGAVTAILTCSNPLVTVVDGTSAFGVIGSGQTKTATDKIQVTFDASTTDETAVEFDLDIRDGGTPTWADKFRKLVHAPLLQLTTLRIDDGAPYGNGNGTNEANEEFLLYYGLKNYGTGTASNLTAVVTDLSGSIVIHDGTDTYPNLLPFVGNENVSGFHLEETNVGTENDLEVAVTDLFGRVYRDTVELRVPDPPLAVEFDASLGPDRLQVAWLHSLTPDVVRYNVYHSENTGGPYTLANVDPLDHAVYLDTDLNPSTAYFFVVTSIDISGNESAFSGEYSASTNPPQMPGFPIQMKTTTTSSPAVGDIDGDGDKEIVVGNEHVYAWHHDGIELRDGDGDPQTWGVLNTVGGPFTAAVALANLDNKPGLDIMAADLNNEIYCMDFNGDLLPGWPKTAERDFRAAPAAGDLDGDGFFEVIAVDSRGGIYVWHSDGTEYRDLGGTDGIFYRTATTSFHFESPTVCDLDGDHLDEIIVGSRADSVWAIKEDGSLVPGFPYRLAGEAAGSICAGDVDDDGFLELLVQTKGTSGKVHLINHDGTVAAGWPRSIQLRDIFFTPSPALADFNNDGKLESVVYWWDGIQAKIYIIDYQGNDYPGWPVVISTSYTESSPVIADIDGNGVLDIVLGDETRFIYAWDISGNLIPGFPVQAEDAVRATPFLDDIDGDNDIDLVLHSWDQSIYAFDLNGAYDPNLAPWPTLQANSHRNGCIGFVVPTAAGSASFFFNIERNGIELTWLVHANELERFDIRRSAVEDGNNTGFVTIASDVAAVSGSMIRFDDPDVEMGRSYVYQLVSKSDGDDIFTSETIYIPVTRADLFQNYPNPFNPSTQIAYYVPDTSDGHVSLVIYDVTGARVRTLVNDKKTAGRYVAVWDGRNGNGTPVGSGVYFYRMTQKGYTATKKMLLLK